MVTGAVLFAGFWGTTSQPHGVLIDCDHISLGSLRPDEHREFVLRVRNRGRSSVQVAVQPACGCITRTVDDRNLLIDGGAEVEIPMRLTAPCLPGPVSKSIRLLASAESAEPFEAVAKLSGTVDAQYWAEPCKATVNLVGENDLTVEFLVHHPESAPLEVRTRGDAEGQLELTPVNARTSRLKALYKQSSLADEGGIVIEIRPAGDESSAETVLLPVHWTKCSVLSFTPTRLRVAASQHEYKVFLPRAGAAATTNILVEPVVSWVRVTEKAASDSGIMIHLAIDAGALNDLRQPTLILRARLSEESHWTYLDAVPVH